jgi:hypothetical protein
VGTQGTPSFPGTGVEHAFLLSSQVLDSHGFEASHIIGVPVQTPIVHVSFVVQKSPSSHAMPSLMAVGLHTLLRHDPMLHAFVSAAQSVWWRHGMGPSIGASVPASEPPPVPPPTPELLLVEVCPPVPS